MEATTGAGALTANWTDNLSVHRTTPNQRSRTGQGDLAIYFKNLSVLKYLKILHISKLAKDKAQYKNKKKSTSECISLDGGH